MTIQQIYVTLSSSIQESDSLKEIVNSRFNIQTTGANKIYRLLETVFEFVFSQVT